MKYLTVFLFFAIIYSCSQAPKSSENHEQRPVALENGKIIHENGKKLLWGGQDSTWHFDITNSTLVDSQYHYGIGREKFDALIKPEFITLKEADDFYEDKDRFLLLDINGEARAYGIDLLTHHEVVNDVVDGKPVMAAYCILADLGAVYDRKLNNKEFTFALTGYTYYDPDVWDGMDGFLLWDRETESIWWPLTGKAVSGPLKGMDMKVWDEEEWSQTTWEAVKKSYTSIDVLKPGQEMDHPQNWRTYTDVESIVSDTTQKSVAPKWGDNSR